MDEHREAAVVPDDADHELGLDTGDLPSGVCSFCGGEGWYGDVWVVECLEHGTGCAPDDAVHLVCAPCKNLREISNLRLTVRCPTEHPLSDGEMAGVRLDREALGLASPP